jgi:hypothetical protein
MNNDEWIKFEDAMPRLNQEIEIQFDDNRILKVHLVKEADHKGWIINFVLFNDLKGEANLERVVGWRPLQEKKPDFSKLKEKDMLRLTLRFGKEEEIFIGFLVCMDENILTMSPIFTAPYPHNSFSYHKSTVKSIIRINPETKEFEEI